jgi:dipeptidyl-peptidase-3
MMECESFGYKDEHFADIQMLRYRLNGFDSLTLMQKKLVYYLSQATLFGRDITFDQFGKHNLRIRKILETVYRNQDIDRDCDEFRALEIYLKRVWFSNGIYHHYGCDKFNPGFDESYFRIILHQIDAKQLPLEDGQTVDELLDEVCPVIFNPNIFTL